MPQMGGLEAMRIIRAREAASSRRLPIIAITAHTMKGDREKFLEAGMDGYVAKPVDPRELVNTVEAAVSGPGAAPPRAAAPPVGEATDAAHWSAAAMVERLGGDEALARELVGLFVTEYPRMMAAVRDSVASGSADDVRRAAHALKGSVSNFIDGPAAAAAFALERIGRENRLDDAAVALESLDREMDALLRHLRDFQSGVACAS